MRVLLAVLVLLVACGGDPGADRPAEPAVTPTPPAEIPMERSPIDEVLDRNSARLMAIDGVQGIYVGQTTAGEPCLRLMATTAPGALDDQIEDSLEGWPLEIEYGDEVKPLD